MAPPDDLFTRGEVLGGLPAKRASTLLFLIEGRTAHLVARAREVTDLFPTEEAARERDLAFLEAFSMGRELPLRPTIQDLEHYAPQWTPLVPVNPQLRAALAHVLGQRYTFTSETVPRIRSALGLETESVQSAYRRLYRESLETIFAPQTKVADRLRWASAGIARWLEALPPFWAVVVLTVTLGLPQAFLALPIAVASVGPLPGVALVVILGFLNMLTMACMAETVARSGTIRYGSAYIGRLVADFLGSAGSVVLTLAVATIFFLALLASYIGLSATMASFTGIPAVLWAMLLAASAIYVLSRGSPNLTVTLMVLLATINISLILGLSFLALPHLRVDNLLTMAVPFLDKGPFKPSDVQRLFGVLLILYFTQALMIQIARVVFRRDPSSRSLIWGSAVGTACSTVLFCLWLLAVSGAVASGELAGQSGTAVVPLARQVGPVAGVLGAGLAVLLLGQTALRCSTVLFNLVRERLPGRPRVIVTLPRERARLRLHPRGQPGGNPLISLTYLGSHGGQSRFRLDVQMDGDLRREEINASGRWDATELFERPPHAIKGRIRLVLDVLDANDEGVRLEILSSMTVTYDGDWDASGLPVMDVLTLPDAERRLVKWMMRQGEVSLAAVVAHTGQAGGDARAMLDSMLKQGLFQEIDAVGDEPRYRVRLAPRRGGHLPAQIWDKLGEKVEVTSDAGRVGHWRRTHTVARRAWEVAVGERGRFFLSISPVLIALILTIWLFMTGAQSFTRVLNFAGVIAVSLLSGIFPVLLLVSSRRKGDSVPGLVLPFLGHPLVVATIYTLFLAGIFSHGLFIWQSPPERAGALIVALVVIGTTVAMVRRGAFAARMVVELRQDQREGGRAAFAIIAGGQPAMANVVLGYSEGEERHQTASGVLPQLSALRYVTFHLPATSARELKVWAHTVTPEGSSEGLPALAEVHCGNETRRFDLKLSGGQVVLPLTGDACWVRITLSEPSSS
jgi:amino acid permease